MKSWLLALALALALPLAGAARAEPAATGRSVDEIQECLRANAPSSTSVQTLVMRAVDRVGSQTDTRAEIFWSSEGDDRNRSLVRIHEPATRRGSALLLVQKGDRSDMWMYLPDLKKTKRITKHSIQGSMFGTDLSYEDFERLQGLGEDAEPKRLPDDVVEGRPTDVIEVRPARDEDSQYERIVAHIEKERCVPLRLEMIEAGGRLRKVMTFPLDQIKETKNGPFPHLIRVEDVIDGTHTDLIVEEIRFDAKIPRNYFSQSNLEFGG